MTPTKFPWSRESVVKPSSTTVGRVTSQKEPTMSSAQQKSWLPSTGNTLRDMVFDRIATRTLLKRVEAKRPTRPPTSSLLPEALLLLERLATRPAGLDELLRAERESADLEEELELAIRLAVQAGEDPELFAASEAVEVLKRVRSYVYRYEKDDDLRRQALSIVRGQIPAEAGDEELLTLSVRVRSGTWDPVTDETRQLIAMLVRSMSPGIPSDEKYVLNVPQWFVRWFLRRPKNTGFEVDSVRDAVANDPDILLTACELWQPGVEDSTYRSSWEALDAASRLG